jgi:hypothetical protein
MDGSYRASTSGIASCSIFVSREGPEVGVEALLRNAITAFKKLSQDQIPRVSIFSKAAVVTME